MSKRDKSKIIPSDYFKNHVNYYNVLGVWTDMRVIGGSLAFTMIYSILAITFFIIAPQICHVVYMYKARDNVVAFADEFYVSLASLNTLFKDYVIIKNRNDVKEMLEIMGSKTMVPNEKQKKNFYKEMNLWKKLSWFLFILENLFTFCILVTPIIDRLKNGTKNVPLVDCYPFYIYSSPVYESMYIYQCFLLWYLIMHTLLFDTFVTGLMTFCSAECDVLSDNLVALKLEETEVEYIKKLVKCIEHHEEIRKFTGNIEKCFSLPILGQYFASLISCCTTMFKLSLAEPMSVEFYKVLCYQCIIFVQMFMYCWPASDLTEKSQRIPLAAYEAFRVEASKYTKSTLKLFIGKTQKPLIVRTLLFDLSMQQYLQLFRSSFSYYTVLGTLNEK